MGLQYVLSIFGRTLSDRPLSSTWRMTLVLFRTRRRDECARLKESVRRRVRKSRQKEAAGAADAGLMEIEWREAGCRSSLEWSRRVEKALRLLGISHRLPSLRRVAKTQSLAKHKMIVSTSSLQIALVLLCYKRRAPTKRTTRPARLR